MTYRIEIHPSGRAWVSVVARVFLDGDRENKLLFESRASSVNNVALELAKEWCDNQKPAEVYFYDPDVHDEPSPGFTIQG